MPVFSLPEVGMDGLKRLAEKLAKQTVEPRPQKAPHTLSVNHRVYTVLLAYCRRKELIIGDIVSDLMQMLVTELESSGDLLPEDHVKAAEYDKTKDAREDRKKIKKVG